ncbi:MAG: YDG domain-containing protein [Candidatus Fimimonas sp.]
MKKEKTKTKKTAEERTDFIVGFVAIVAVFALFTALIVLMGNRNVGEIAYAGETQRGNEQVFTYKTRNVKKGDTVTWFVNNQKVQSYVYDDGEVQFRYTPTEVGNFTVKVVSGKYTQSKVVKVGMPVLRLEAKDIEITYGEEIPKLEYACNGLVCNDAADCVTCEIACESCDKPSCESCERLPCGEYPITISNVKCCNYQVETQNATLRVLPKEVKVANSLEKVYDQTSTINNPKIVLSGVLEGDEVFATAKSISLESKNAGSYTINTADVLLQGKDSKNYFLCKETKGKILPKEITLQGLTVADKTYDGTTKANIAKMGTLRGVCEGDSVAVGSLEIAFDNANLGLHGVNVKNVKLVGYDKDNYVVKTVDVNNARITADERLLKKLGK